MIEVAPHQMGRFPLVKFSGNGQIYLIHAAKTLGKVGTLPKMSGEVIGKKKGRQTERATGQTFIYIQIKQFFDCQFNQLLTGHIILRWNV